MCWLVCYIYKCGHDSTTTFKCCKCAKSEEHCLELSLSETCPLKEVCHDCSITPDSLAGDLAVDLVLEGDRLIVPLQTNRLLNIMVRRPPRRRRLTPLQSIPAS